ncbi:MAG: hypothetical protein HGA49_00360 [Eubacteriaceae bacterium]|nr:hypothetical protein [Eubacteriaceae bacterium]
MIYNSIDLNSVLNVLSVSGRDVIPPYSLVRSNLPKAENPMLAYKKNEERSIIAKCIVKGISKSAIRDTIRNSIAPYLYPSDLIYKSLILSDEPTKEWLAIPDGEIKITDDNPRYCVFEASFIAKLYALSTAETTETGINGVVNTNSGTAPALGMITFSITSGTSQMITLFGTTSQIKLEDTNLAGNWEIDMENRTVKKNGVLANNKTNFSLTNWQGFVVPAGAYQFDFSPAQNAMLTYKRRWL